MSACLELGCIEIPERTRRPAGTPEPGEQACAEGVPGADGIHHADPGSRRADRHRLRPGFCTRRPSGEGDAPRPALEQISSRVALTEVRVEPRDVRDAQLHQVGDVGELFEPVQVAVSIVTHGRPDVRIDHERPCARLTLGELGDRCSGGIGREGERPDMDRSDLCGQLGEVRQG